MAKIGICMILADTDIIIEFLKGSKETKQSLEIIRWENIAISSITLMELYYGAFNKQELLKIKKNLSFFPTLKINNQVTDIAVNLIEKYSKSHNLEIPDSLIAGTSIFNSMKLLTFNKKDFVFIKELKLYEHI